MSCLSDVLKNSEEFKTLFDAVEKENLPAAVNGLAHINKVHLIHALCAETDRRAVIVVPDEAQASKTVSDLNALQGGAYVYPARDFVFRSMEGQSREYEHRRLHVLKKMLDGDYTAVVLSAEAALQLTLPPEEMLKRTMLLKCGEDVPVNDVIAALLAAGYVRAEQVDGIGQFAHRGGILDFFPPGRTQPIRVEFWGDTVDTIAGFDVETQRRGEPEEEAEITPAVEILFDSPQALAQKIKALSDGLKGRQSKARASLQDDMQKLAQGMFPASTDRYLPLAYENPACVFDYARDAILFVSETSTVKERCRSNQTQMNEDITALLEEGVLASGLDCFSLDYTQLLENFEEQGAVYMESFPRASYETPIRALCSVAARRLSSSGTEAFRCFCRILNLRLKAVTGSA